MRGLEWKGGMVMGRRGLQICHGMRERGRGGRRGRGRESEGEGLEVGECDEEWEGGKIEGEG